MKEQDDKTKSQQSPKIGINGFGEVIEVKRSAIKSSKVIDGVDWTPLMSRKSPAIADNLVAQQPKNPSPEVTHG